MNYKARALAVLVAATVSSAAMASDGKIDFNGELKAETCQVAVNGAAASGGDHRHLANHLHRFLGFRRASSWPDRFQHRTEQVLCCDQNRGGVL